MQLKPLAAALCAGLLFAAGAQATTLTFDELADGAVLSNQYAALGVTFSPNAFSGAGGPTGDWATNTDMTVTSTDLGGLGTPTLVSGNVLHSFGGWLDEDGDASFSADFSTAISNFSAAFAGVAVPGDVRLFAYNGTTLLGSVAGTETSGQFTLSFAAASITRVVITPGSFDDWVGVDNITFTQAVPEPGSYALMALGMAGVLVAVRRRARRDAA